MATKITTPEQLAYGRSYLFCLRGGAAIAGVYINMPCERGPLVVVVQQAAKDLVRVNWRDIEDIEWLA